MIPEGVKQVICQAKLPCFVYDLDGVKQRVGLVASLLDRYFFPVKACPESEVVRCAIEAGAALDLCSAGDLDIALSNGCNGESCSFTSGIADEALMRSLLAAGTHFVVDTLEQGLRWAACGGRECGLRLTPQNPRAIYGHKFGVPPKKAGVVAQHLESIGLKVCGFHLHDQHTHFTGPEFAVRVAQNFSEVDRKWLRESDYVNVGGSWPMRHGNPASAEELRGAISILRERLGELGFTGRLHGEPGRWVVGPCGYLAARVAALKEHPAGHEYMIALLDTSTPVPNRPSLLPFTVIREGALMKGPKLVKYDIYGASNTALDVIGANVRLPTLAVGDFVVSSGQGAYTRSLIPPFNERERPVAFLATAGSGRELGQNNLPPGRSRGSSKIGSQESIG